MSRTSGPNGKSGVCDKPSTGGRPGMGGRSGLGTRPPWTRLLDPGPCESEPGADRQAHRLADCTLSYSSSDSTSESSSSRPGS